MTRTDRPVLPFVSVIDPDDTDHTNTPIYEGTDPASALTRGIYPCLYGEDGDIDGVLAVRGNGDATLLIAEEADKVLGWANRDGEVWPTFDAAWAADEGRDTPTEYRLAHHALTTGTTMFEDTDEYVTPDDEPATTAYMLAALRRVGYGDAHETTTGGGCTAIRFETSPDTHVLITGIDANRPDGVWLHVAECWNEDTPEPPARFDGDNYRMIYNGPHAPTSALYALTVAELAPTDLPRTN